MTPGAFRARSGRLTCEQRRDLMLCYLSGLLDPAEAQELRQHLTGGCVACSAALAEAQATLAALPLALEPIAPSPAARQRLMDRIAAQESPAGSISEDNTFPYIREPFDRC